MLTTKFSAQQWASAPSETEVKVQEVVRQIEEKQIDITSGYDNWRNIGFALADELGERGRAYYQRVSAFYPNHKEEEIDKQYTKCLEGKGSGITIGTFFHLASQFEITVSTGDFAKNPKVQNTNWKNGKMGKWEKEDDSFSSFPDEVYANLPPFLLEVVNNSISSNDRDIILLGAIVCLSACLSNVCGVYDERIIYPNLYLFVIADAGMGKGALTLCRELVAPINRELREITKYEEQEYKQAMIAHKGSKGEMPVEPPQRMLIIPANSSASSFLKILADNKGKGLLFETEGDTLSQTLNSDYGNYSDVLRKAFHHELLSLSRKTDRISYEVEKPRVSVVLAGTPEQVGRLIPDSENGLMSRFIFYNIPFVRNFRNVFQTSDVSKSKNVKFQTMGEIFLKMNKEFTRRGDFSFCIPSDLQPQFVDYFDKTNEDCCDEVNNGMQGVVRRMALIAFRLMMTLAAIREMSEKSSCCNQIVCQPCDYHTAMNIIQALVNHSIFIYQKLSRSSYKSESRKDKQNRFYDALPKSFTKSEYQEMSKAEKLPLSTTDKWIDEFIKSGKLNRISQGNYEKI